MLLPSNASYSVPDETARVAHAIFPKGNIYVGLYDALGSKYQQRDFADLFSALGQPAIQPVRLALVCILQFMEGLTDQQAADAVRTCIDWKYLLYLELTDTGFDASVLSEFRSRLVNESVLNESTMSSGSIPSIEQRLLDTLLTQFWERGLLLKAGSRVRTDSTPVLRAISALNRLKLAIESMRYTLNTLAMVTPGWLLQHTSPDWVDSYSSRADDFPLPKKEQERLALIQLVGADGFALLEAIDEPTAPLWLCQVTALRILCKIWVQNYMRNEGQISWREPDNILPATLFVSSTYDQEAHYAKKWSTSWTGYKIHLTESCDDGAPHLITNVETSPVPSPDTAATPVVHQKLKDKGLLPNKHLVDMGYIEIDLEAKTRLEHGVDLVGPMRRSRYIGQSKTHLQHILTAIGINLVRFDNWLSGKEPAQTRQCAFVRLLAAA